MSKKHKKKKQPAPLGLTTPPSEVPWSRFRRSDHLPSIENPDVPRGIINSPPPPRFRISDRLPPIDVPKRNLPLVVEKSILLVRRDGSETEKHITALNEAVAEARMQLYGMVNLAFGEEKADEVQALLQQHDELDTRMFLNGATKGDEQALDDLVTKIYQIWFGASLRNRIEEYYKKGILG